MKIERTKNTARNILSGTIMKIFQMLMPFAMRTMMIYCMGEKYLGLNSLFTSVLQVLNLAELGISSAMVYSMYKPIAEDDAPTICALMKLYRTYYRIIGLVVGVLGLLLLPWIPKLVHDELPPELNLYVLYLMNLAATVLSYWMFAYRNSLLTAHHRSDVLNIVLLFTQIGQYAMQAVILLWLKNYYLYVAAILVMQIANNLICAAISRRMYPDYAPRGRIKPDYHRDINARIRDLFISRLGSVVLGSTDTIVISAFLGLSTLAIYQNYFFIISSIYGLMEVILNAMLAGLGNSMVAESRERNFHTMKRINILFIWLTFICVCCFAGVFQPFMELWMGKERMLSYGMVFSFCTYFLVYEIVRLFNTFKNAAGEWHQDRFRPLISAVVNLCLNLFLVRTIGLYGIIWSSIVALGCIEIPWLLHNVFTTVYKGESLRAYGKQLLPYLLAGFFAWGLTAAVTALPKLDAALMMPISLVVSAGIPTGLFLLLFRHKADFQEGLALLERMAGGRIPIRKWLHINAKGDAA